MSRLNQRTIIVIVCIFLIVGVAYGVLYSGYQRSLQVSSNAVETQAAILHATAVATLAQ